MDDTQIWMWAQSQLQGGASEDEVEGWIKQNTRHPNLFSLRMAAESVQERQQAEQLTQQAIGEEPVRQFIGSMTQGASLGGVDELLSMFSPQLGARARLAQQEREQFAPGADIVAGLGGGMLVPGVGAARAASAGTRGLLSIGGRGAARGALVGAGTGAATGALMAQPGERGEGAVRGAAAGGIFGAPLGAVGGLAGAAVRRGGGRVRAIRSLIEKSGREMDDASKINVLADIEERKLNAQDLFFRPLEADHPVVGTPAVNDFLFDAGSSINNQVKGTIPRHLRPLGQRTRSGRGRATGQRLVRPSARPSFTELQRIRSDLREAAFDATGDLKDIEARNAYNELTSIMEGEFGERFVQGNAAWRQASQMEQLVNRGWSKYDAPFEDIIQIERSLQDPDVIESFRRGRLARWQSELSRSDAARRKLFTLAEDPDRSAAIATMFPEQQEGQAWRQFMDLMQTEASKEQLVGFIDRILTSGAVAVGGGLVGGSIGARQQ